VTDYRDWQVPLGRRFRSLKLWLVLRHYGAERLRAMIRSHVALANGLARRVEAEPRFELAAPASLGLVCFRHRGGDRVNQELMDRLNAEGTAYLTHTRLDERLTLRFSIGQYRTGPDHVEAAWERLLALAGEISPT
jgi:aromatic-L-amino-acid decarboxylase